MQKYNHSDYKILKNEILYQGVFRLSRYTLQHKLFNGDYSPIYQRELFERKSAVAILPHDPVLDRIILIEQFRPGALADPCSPWLIEIPAGIIEANETPEEVAHRESMEEAGCQLLEYKPIYNYFASPGGSNEFLHIFYGRIDSKGIEGIHGLVEEEEDIRVLNVSTAEAFDLLGQGKIKNAPTLIGLLWLKLNIK